jgi:hypothetical protein
VRELLLIGSARSFLREAASGTILELLRALGPASAGKLLGSCQQLREFVCPASAAATATSKQQQQQQQQQQHGASKAAGAAGAKDAAPASSKDGKQGPLPEALALSLFLWPLMTKEMVSQASPLLPQNSPAPPLSASFSPSAAAPKPPAGSGAGLSACRAALFSPSYLRGILPALQDSISSNPRLHSVWSMLLPLLLPGMGAAASDPKDTAASAGPASIAQVSAVLCRASVDRSAGQCSLAFLSHPFRLAPSLVPLLTLPPSLTCPSVFSQVEAFWSVVVEEGLLASTSHERKFLAFKLFQVGSSGKSSNSVMRLEA